MNVPVQQVFPENSRIEFGLDSKEDIDFTELKRNERRLAQCNALDLQDGMAEILSHRIQGM